ncbi:MAG TPA: GYD domain-containing protein [Anaerolineales bacterium]|nr:GYD domain-containing protein [Anaerolineales bacterium]
MATYIVLGNYTHQGMDKIKGAPARIDTAREVMHKLGAELKQWYLVTGQYDFVLILEAPNDETVAKLMLAIGSHGNLRTQTSRAFTEEEFRQIVTDLPY